MSCRTATLACAGVLTVNTSPPVHAAKFLKCVVTGDASVATTVVGDNGLSSGESTAMT